MENYPTAAPPGALYGVATRCNSRPQIIGIFSPLFAAAQAFNKVHACPGGAARVARVKNPPNMTYIYILIIYFIYYNVYVMAARLIYMYATRLFILNKKPGPVQLYIFILRIRYILSTAEKSTAGPKEP
jgi:hypothetical protein